MCVWRSVAHGEGFGREAAIKKRHLGRRGEERDDVRRNTHAYTHRCVCSHTRIQMCGKQGLRHAHGSDEVQLQRETAASMLIRSTSPPPCPNRISFTHDLAGVDAGVDIDYGVRKKHKRRRAKRREVPPLRGPLALGRI